MRGARWLAAAAVLSAGCASYSTRVSPRPTPPGETRYGFNLDAQMLQPAGANRTVPNFEFTVRHGLTERVDIGGKVGVFGGEFNTKMTLVTGRLSVALLPSTQIGFAPFGTDEDIVPFASFGLPVLLGLQLGSAELVAAPRIHLQASPAETVTGGRPEVGTLLLGVGGTLGLRFEVDTWVVFPELGVLAPYAVDVESWEGVVWQGGVGIQFGSPP